MYIHNEDVWTTVVVLHIDAPTMTGQQLDAARDDVIRFVHYVDAVFSTFKSDSLVSQYRRGEIDDDALDVRDDEAARDLLDVISLSRKALFTSMGAFDPWSVEGGFDPSGLVKGWAAERACNILRGHGITRAYVNAGGDVFSITDGEPWICGVADPDDRMQVVQRAIVPGAGAVCTSGTYERGSHIIDPQRQQPAEGARAATVVGPDAALADAYATAICIQGPNAIEWFKELGPEWSLFVIPNEDRIGFTYGDAWA